MMVLDEENVKWTISSMKNDGDDGELEGELDEDKYTLGNMQEIKNFVALIPNDGVKFFIQKVKKTKKIIELTILIKLFEQLLSVSSERWGNRCSARVFGQIDQNETQGKIFGRKWFAEHFVYPVKDRFIFRFQDTLILTSQTKNENIISSTMEIITSGVFQFKNQKTQ